MDSPGKWPGFHSNQYFRETLITTEEHVLDTNAGKQVSLAATDV